MTVTSNSGRVYGAVVAAGIAAVWTAVPIVIGLVGQDPSVVKLSAVWLGPSIPVAAALAFLLTPWAMGSHSIHRPSWAMGFFSVVVGAPAVGVALAAVSPVQNLGEAFALVVFSTLFGLIFVGWLYLIITVPSGYVWAAIVRRRVGITK